MQYHFMICDPEDEPVKRDLDGRHHPVMGDLARAIDFGHRDRHFL